MAAPSPGYSITVRVEAPTDAAATARLSSVVAEAGGAITALDVAESHHNMLVVDVSCNATDVEHSESITKAIAALEGFSVRKVSDRTFLLHLGGKIEVMPKVPLKHRDDLSRAYTPGVARVSMAIAENPADARRLTIKRNTVAVVTDGSAVLGLGNIGPAAALDTQDSEKIIEIVKAIAPVYGGVNLEDISAPRCFEIEERLRAELDIPVFHDDQHGTAIVVLGALINALRVVNKDISQVRFVISGVGAAGSAIIRLLKRQGATMIIGCDSKGAVYDAPEGSSDMRRWLVDNTNFEKRTGSLKEVLVGADVFIGVSAPNILDEQDIANMAENAIVFALANPIPEVDPTEAQRHAAVVATGRSDFPNQINNVLAFPGVFRGLLDGGIRHIDDEMLSAAANAIANKVASDQLNPSYIIPSVFDASVSPAVAAAVRKVGERESAS
jgi:malate dehydrogenase (oxaloacetate-decarboxylating)